MRLTYILGIVLAATLHASSSAIPATKGHSTMLGHGVSPDAVDSVHRDGGRLLRRVEKPASDGVGIQEERMFGGLTRFFQKLRYAGKLPVTSAGKSKFYRQVAESLRKTQRNR
ncbi:hypothetical protein L914_18244 [Phytophthora nicotianae]|uniref:RxLR effector protein n=1 Tax=Phytophthora nicotianae TaxID=4792 RepID=W2MGX5_PHYNI|nr:hypothetical protein L914_18244 [Phytophthora nicotianae]